MDLRRARDASDFDSAKHHLGSATEGLQDAQDAANDCNCTEAAKLEADEVILAAARVIRFDPRNLVDGKGRRKELHELDEATRLALHVEIDGEGNVKYRSPDKNQAREQLMKHLGLFEKDNRQQPPGAVVHPPGARIEFTPIPKTRKG
jgi:hypothetical protein